MTMKLYNSLTKTKEDFVPIDKEHIRIYFCGPTVYNKLHVGNFRAALVGDLLSKVLKGIYPKVTYVSNITDIDDKIIAASEESNLSIDELTNKYFHQYINDSSLLGISTPDKQPFATDYIPSMISFIEVLLDRGVAYEVNGNVLFDTTTFSQYGVLSDRKLEEQIKGTRIKVESYKKNSNDFILWKPSLNLEPGWDSPWGNGRPGWHLECSVMSQETLSVPFDIHGGGNDLKFPHHDNEIAQTCGFHGTEDPTSFAKYWVHNGFLNLQNEKMSKSEGNVIYLEDLLTDFKGNEIRLALLSSHYRQPIPWSQTLLTQSASIHKKISSKLQNFDHIEPAFHADSEVGKCLLDDLNTPLALSVFQEKIANDNQNINREVATYKYIFEGSNQDNSISVEEIKLIEQLITQRNQARKNGNYEEADKIRDKLDKMKVSIKDIDGKTEWTK